MSGWDKAPEYGGSGGGKWATILAGVAAALFSALVAWLYFASASAQTTTIAGVASVVDGDTVEMHGERIRLSGFDSPERGAMCGATNVYRRAALALSDFIGSRTVHCTVTERDRYDRAVATCSVGGMDLGDYMVEQGWARDWPRYSGGRYADEEAIARAARRGVWSRECPASLWGDRDYSQASAPPSRAVVEELETAYVTANSLNVRAGPRADHPVVGRLPHRTRVEVQERAVDWVRIAASGSVGWVSSSYLSATEPAAAPEPALSAARIRQMIIQRSIASYSGSCPCPYNVDRGGRRCGGRSAYSRPGGASPICYPADVSDAEVQAFRATLAR